ncbi:MAG: hypothetical protein NXH75_02195 [Halobacteriovoraceae bacterium]|nr:hypothetical protein [Halobacteriovoraceae bacterium]
MGIKWTQKAGRSQAAGWIFFSSKGFGKNIDEAYQKAEGRALKMLTQECRLINRYAKFHERCDEQAGNQTIAYARVSLRKDDCLYSQTNDDSTNLILTKQLKVFLEKVNTKDTDKKNKNEKEILAKLQKLQSQLDTLAAQKRNSKINKEINQKDLQIKKLEKKLRYHASSCRSKESCLRLAKESFVKDDFSPSSRYALDGCERYNSGESCNLVGMILRDQLKNNKRAEQLFRLACNKFNHPQGCTNYAWQLMVNKKRVNRKPYLEKACKLNDPMGCYSLASFISSKDLGEAIRNKIKGYWKKNAPIRWPKMAPLLKKACLTLKSSEACIDAGQLVFNQQMKDKFPIGEKYLKLACYELGNIKGCVEAAKFNIYPYSRGFMTDKKAKGFLKYACENDPSTCGNFGKFLYHKLSDSKKAKMYLKEGCEEGSGKSCLMWGVLLSVLGEDKNLEVAFQKGCENRSLESCDQLGFVYKYHKKEIGKAKEAFVKGCQLEEKGTFYKGMSSSKDTKTRDNCAQLALIRFNSKKKFKGNLNLESSIMKGCLARGPNEHRVFTFHGGGCLAKAEYLNDSKRQKQKAISVYSKLCYSQMGNILARKRACKLSKGTYKANKYLFTY